jgi:hypothetical protein
MRLELDIKFKVQRLEYKKNDAIAMKRRSERKRREKSKSCAIISSLAGGFFTTLPRVLSRVGVSVDFPFFGDPRDYATLEVGSEGRLECSFCQGNALADALGSYYRSIRVMK